ncbi:hypothetical protein EV2_022746 [Malus domestica]
MGFLEGIRISAHRPILSHLLFVDNTLIFLAATKENCENIVHLLKAFCFASRHEVNLQKSVVYFSANTLSDVQEDLCTILNLSRVENPGSYLGSSAVWGKTKSVAMSYIMDRVLSKIQG